MALWPPSLINNDKSSLSAGAFKVSNTHCAKKIKNSHQQERVESTIEILAADKWDVEQTLCKWLSKAMRNIVCHSAVLYIYADGYFTPKSFLDYVVECFKS